MKRKKFISLLILSAMLIVSLSGCGKSGQDNTSSPVAGTDTQNTEAGNTASDTDTSGKDINSASDEILGEWQYMCTLFHSESSDGEPYDDVTMCTDEYSPDTAIIIRKDGDKIVADYKYQGYESSTKYVGIELQYKEGAPYADAENRGFYLLPDPFGDDYGNRAISLDSDGRLTVASEYTDEADEYYYYSLSRDIYLRKGSPEFNDPENLKYFDTVTVSDPAELLNSIKNSRKIILKEGLYNLSAVMPREIDNPNITAGYNDYVISNVHNLCIEAEEGADVHILTGNPYSPVLSFSGCRNITINNITAGHDAEPGYCSGSVLYFDNADGVNIDGCSLYGSGTYGVEAQYSYDINVTDTDIYECTYGLVSLSNIGTTLFQNCTMKDSSEYSMIYISDAYDVLFENCEFKNNRADGYDVAYFVEKGEDDNVTFRNCSFQDNVFDIFSNYDVILENCTADNNRAGFNELLNVQISDEPDADELLSQYESALKRQDEIDEQLQTGDMLLLSQQSLNELAYEDYSIWDNLINRIWAYLSSTLDDDSMNALRDEQKKWIKEKESAMKEAGSDFEGGTMQPMLEYSTGAELTQKRVEVLIKKYIERS